MTSIESRPATEIFDAEYYRTGLGRTPYDRENRELIDFFARIADELIRSLHPKTVFDAGCAMGFLVEAFWDRGIEAHGVDVSSYAISKVRRDMVPFCRLGSLAEPLPARYDLVTCIEVLEHMPDDESRIAVRNLAQAADTILFSSSPFDLSEKTHINVKQPVAWLELFAAEGLSPDLMFDASFVAPQAMLLRRSERPLPWDVLRLFSELIRYKNALITRDAQAQAQSRQFTADLAAERVHLDRLTSEQDQQRIRLEEVRRELIEGDASRQFLHAQLKAVGESRDEKLYAAVEQNQRELENLAGKNAVLVTELERAGASKDEVLRAVRQQLDSQITTLLDEMRHSQKQITELITASKTAAERISLLEEQVRAFAGQIQAAQRRIGSLEVTAWESRTQIGEILGSRTWKTLVRLGGAVIRVFPRSE